MLMTHGKPKAPHNPTAAQQKLPKGLYIASAKGRRYVYAWRGGPRLHQPIGTPAFFAEYQTAKDAQIARPSADTIAGLVLEYRESRAFKQLAQATRKDHERGFEAIICQFGTAPLAAFNDSRIRKDLRQWHESFPRDRQADKILGTLSRLLAFAKTDGLINENPALDIENRYTRNADPSPVPQSIINKVIEADTTPPSVARAIALISLCGLARADAAALSWSHVKSDRIDKRRQKSRVRATPPMTKDLAEILATMPRIINVLTVLTNEQGRPWTSADALGKAISKAFRACNVSYTSHDLRASYACYLMSQGATDEEIAEALGWSLDTARIIRRHYIDDAAIFQGRIAKFSKTKSEQNC